MNERLVDIGIVVAGPLDSIDEQAVARAVEQFEAFVRQKFPSLQWRLHQSRRPESVTSKRTQPSVLLQGALRERDRQHWDFAFVVTSAELESHYSDHCLAALSRPLDAAVFSLSLLDPRAIGVEGESQQRIETIAARLRRLMLHALAHLCGLSRDSEKTNLLFHPANVDELDAMTELSEEQVRWQSESLLEVADQRLEERPGKPLSAIAFTCYSAWINAREILQAIVAARPWEFPRRLSGLTLAAVSTLVVLLMTAEAWDLALSQSGWNIMALALASWLGTTVYVVRRQRLTVPNRRRQSEQIVVTNFSAVGIVFAGMLVTWITLALLAAVIAGLLFRTDLIASWASSTEINETRVNYAHRLLMATFGASLGLIIGALGASFESQHYFRHVIFVDEEI